ncbi:PLP-dependent aminotransferase family protein [Granulosicoccus antarcticus]|uniref:2-aminoadipate transaminase n=1 Tax=Granulosicoccus antarcticus IMCC3135 TaxID=1192854 RepID=A0A2Z2NZ13_9GAMM|nr:PLP-dependent aminotransferase family protein [Granulosicoccus antarcticus]ASJ76553.1 2-aminoadipate transaminase [Granulosicoccus antarcticus IMCC3135]
MANNRQFLYEDVAQSVTCMINDGTLSPGDKAPSLRMLGKQLNVSVATIMQAYEELEKNGLLKARPQSGFYVQASAPLPDSAPRWRSTQAAARKVQIGAHMNEVLASARVPGVLNLAIANPATELLPVKALNRSLKRVCSARATEALSYAPIEGMPELRSSIARRSIHLEHPVNPDSVLITTGATEALSLCLRAVAKAGDIIAVESPAYFGVLQMIESLGMLALEIDTDPVDGLRPDALETVVEREQIAAVVSVGTFNNPTGSVVPRAAREQIVTLLAEHNIPLIEDDIYGELYLGQQKPLPYKAFDKTGQVMTCSGFSKTIAPGYRVGWIVADRYLPELKDLKLISSSSTPTLTQMTMADFLADGRYDRHLTRLRRACREQLQVTRRAVQTHFPVGTRISEPTGGYVLWIQLPRGMDANQLYRDAIAENISITPGALFSSTGKFRNFLRLCAGQPFSDEIARGIQRLGQLAERQRTLKNPIQ